MTDRHLSRSGDRDESERLAATVESFAAADHRLVMTDFDGTIADIVERPDDASIRSDAKSALGTLAAGSQTDVGVVSGRAIDDLAARVDLSDVAYAGNHGLEIAADGTTFVHPDAKPTREAIQRACRRVEDRLDDVDGAIVESKGLTATVHYRMVDDRVEHVRAAVRDVVDDFDAIAISEGKQILELEPPLDWDKGKAVEWITETVSEDPSNAFRVYLGDDVTDEDAFEVIGDRGVAIRVGDAHQTAADVTVPGPDTVVTLLERFVDARDEP